MIMKPGIFLERIIRFLMPYFLDAGSDSGATRSEIIETLASYGARTRAEMLNAAQIIAFGMTTLDTLAAAHASEMSPSMRLRFRGCANRLNRSGQQNEATLAKRLARDALTVIDPLPEPGNDVPTAEAEAVLRQAQVIIEASPANPVAPPVTAGPRPAAGSGQQRNKQIWASAMTKVLADLGMPNGAAQVTCLHAVPSDARRSLGETGQRIDNAAYDKLFRPLPSRSPARDADAGVRAEHSAGPG